MLREIGLVFQQQLRLSLRQPAWLVIALIQPLLYLALFGPLLKPLAEGPGFPPGDAWQVFVPGLLVQLGIFGSIFVGFGLLAEVHDGVVERMRVTPASRFSLLFGRVLRDTAVLVVQALILVATAAAFGLRVPLIGGLAAIVIVALLGLALSSLSYAAALRLRTEDALAQFLNMVSLPILLLSGILLPMSLAPRWLRTLSEANPFSHVVDGTRAAFLDEIGTSLATGLLAAAALALVGLWVGTRTFRRESA
jgi:ABC-2 type transport system permease protein